MTPLPSVTDLIIDPYSRDVSLVGDEILPPYLRLMSDPAADGTAQPDHFAFEASEPAEAQPTCYLQYKLDRVFVKSWSTSADGTSGADTDINIGVGELQECTISKSMDASEDSFVFQGSTSGASQGGYDDLDVDGRDFLVWSRGGSVNSGVDDIDLSLSTVDVGGIPATLGEYGLQIMLI